MVSLTLTLLTTAESDLGRAGSGLPRLVRVRVRVRLRLRLRVGLRLKGWGSGVACRAGV